jgi:hypothetical protein
VMRLESDKYELSYSVGLDSSREYGLSID